jgi:hypothetical protein
LVKVGNKSHVGSKPLKGKTKINGNTKVIAMNARPVALAIAA